MGKHGSRKRKHSKSSSSLSHSPPTKKLAPNFVVKDEPNWEGGDHEEISISMEDSQFKESTSSAAEMLATNSADLLHHSSASASGQMIIKDEEYEKYNTENGDTENGDTENYDTEKLDANYVNNYVDNFENFDNNHINNNANEEDENEDDDDDEIVFATGNRDWPDTCKPWSNPYAPNFDPMEMIEPDLEHEIERMRRELELAETTADTPSSNQHNSSSASKSALLSYAKKLAPTAATTTSSSYLKSTTANSNRTTRKKTNLRASYQPKITTSTSTFTSVDNYNDSHANAKAFFLTQTPKAKRFTTFPRTPSPPSSPSPSPPLVERVVDGKTIVTDQTGADFVVPTGTPQFEKRWNGKYYRLKEGGEPQRESETSASAPSFLPDLISPTSNSNQKPSKAEKMKTDSRHSSVREKNVADFTAFPSQSSSFSSAFDDDENDDDEVNSITSVVVSPQEVMMVNGQQRQQQSAFKVVPNEVTFSSFSSSVPPGPSSSSPRKVTFVKVTPRSGNPSVHLPPPSPVLESCRLKGLRLSSKSPDKVTSLPTTTKIMAKHSTGKNGGFLVIKKQEEEKHPENVVKEKVAIQRTTGSRPRRTIYFKKVPKHVQSSILATQGALGGLASLPTVDDFLKNYQQLYSKSEKTALNTANKTPRIIAVIPKVTATTTTASSKAPTVTPITSKANSCVTTTTLTLPTATYVAALAKDQSLLLDDDFAADFFQANQDDYLEEEEQSNPGSWHQSPPVTITVTTSVAKRISDAIKSILTEKYAHLQRASTATNSRKGKEKKQKMITNPKESYFEREKRIYSWLERARRDKKKRKKKEEKEKAKLMKIKEEAENSCEELHHMDTREQQDKMEDSDEEVATAEYFVDTCIDLLDSEFEDDDEDEENKDEKEEEKKKKKTTVVVIKEDPDKKGSGVQIILNNTEEIKEEGNEINRRDKPFSERESPALRRFRRQYEPLFAKYIEPSDLCSCAGCLEDFLSDPKGIMSKYGVELMRSGNSARRKAQAERRRLHAQANRAKTAVAASTLEGNTFSVPSNHPFRSGPSCSSSSSSSSSSTTKTFIIQPEDRVARDSYGRSLITTMVRESFKLPEEDEQVREMKRNLVETMVLGTRLTPAQLAAQKAEEERADRMRRFSPGGLPANSTLGNPLVGPRTTTRQYPDGFPSHLLLSNEHYFEFSYACQYPGCRLVGPNEWNMRRHIRTIHLRLPVTKRRMEEELLDVEKVEREESKYLQVTCVMKKKRSPEEIRLIEEEKRREAEEAAKRGFSLPPLKKSSQFPESSSSSSPIVIWPQTREQKPALTPLSPSLPVSPPSKEAFRKATPRKMPSLPAAATGASVSDRASSQPPEAVVKEQKKEKAKKKEVPKIKEEIKEEIVEETVELRRSKRKK